MIEFKSSNLYFYDEQAGLKNWTIREIPKETDVRFTVLRNMIRTKSYLKEPKEIKIIQAELPNNSFVRQIKHITTWKNYYLITWRA